MKNYTNSDYALNKYSQGIVYRFADGIREISLADFLAENPDKTEDDFLALKELSDTIYLNQVRDENAQSKKNSPLDAIDETLLCCVPSPEDLFFGEIDAEEDVNQHKQRLKTARYALDKLTEIQQRRYLMHVVEGLSTWQIAQLESANQKSVHESLQGAEKKIKKVLAQIQKTPPQNT